MTVAEFVEEVIKNGGSINSEVSVRVDDGCSVNYVPVAAVGITTDYCTNTKSVTVRLADAY